MYKLQKGVRGKAAHKLTLYNTNSQTDLDWHVLYVFPTLSYNKQWWMFLNMDVIIRLTLIFLTIFMFCIPVGCCVKVYKIKIECSVRPGKPKTCEHENNEQIYRQAWLYMITYFSRIPTTIRG